MRFNSQIPLVNAIEGRIGNAKQLYSLNQIKAKLKETSQTWIVAVIFTMNIASWMDKRLWNDFLRKPYLVRFNREREVLFKGRTY